VVFGHKSLVVDRLDTQAMSWDTDLGTISDTQRLIPGATLIAYARNRTYSPGLGRWLQQDPNGSGAAVLAHRFFGASTSVMVHTTDLTTRAADGLSLLCYVQSNPTTRSDPSGLYSTDELMEDVSGASFGIPSPADFITGVLQALVEDYAENQSFDVDWAMDWNLPDDDHSRTDNSWMVISFGRGLYEAFEIGIGDYKTNLLGPTASKGGKKSGGSGGGGAKRRSTTTGSTPATALGQRKHAEYRIKMEKMGYQTEFDLKSAGRCDAIDTKNKVLRELKPNTPSGIARGWKQLWRYWEYLRSHPDPKVRGNYKVILDTY
jgi:hypothetical protein